jgi:hypothetical protein
MENKFKVGQKVRIVSKEQLVELEHNGADIIDEMIEAGGKIVTILYVVPKYLWLTPTMPEYKVEEEPVWTWYENLLEPIE